MSELINTLTGVLQQFGTTEIAGLLIAAGLLLIWLIIRVLLRRSEDSASQVQAKSQQAQERATMQDSALSGQAGRIQQAPPTPESKPVPAAEPVIRAATKPEPENWIPEDSVLRRHYLANLQAQRDAMAHPYPTDSVQHRHYDQAHKLVVDTEPAAGAAVNRNTKGSIIEQAIDKDGPASASSPVASAPAAKCTLPQDSVLKRHVIAQLQAEIEARFSPRPSDSILRRHYENLIRCELENRLAGLS